jgi:hypothetical protein
MKRIALLLFASTTIPLLAQVAPPSKQADVVFVLTPAEKEQQKVLKKRIEDFFASQKKLSAELQEFGQKTLAAHGNPAGIGYDANKADFTRTTVIEDEKK